MKKHILLLLFLTTITVNAQNDTWYAFSTKNSYLKGFKDSAGKVMIEPKFMGLTSAEKFSNIMAAMEEYEDGKVGSYYLLKNGRKIGKDSLYIWDMALDCESEGSIRFKDPKTDKVGFFNSLGEIIIPAIYSDAYPFRNGLAVVRKDAHKVGIDGTPYHKNNNAGEYWTWQGGETMLITKDNKVLIHNFKYNQNTDLYSMKKNDTLPNSLKQIGTDHNFYSFNNHKEDFIYWLNDFINNINQGRKNKLSDTANLKLLINKFMPEIYFMDIKWATGKSIKLETNQIIKKNATYFVNTFLDLQEEEADFFISKTDLKTIVANDPTYEKYFNDCGDALEAKYPVFSIVSNYYSEGSKFQEIFSFLKTDTGFKLINIETLNNIIYTQNSDTVKKYIVTNEGEKIYPVKEYYDNGKIKFTGFYDNKNPKVSNKTGEWKEYYKNGQISVSSNYTKGAKDGLWKWYLKNGDIRQIGTYKNNKKVGEWKLYSYKKGAYYKTENYDTNGKKTGEWKYYKKGKIFTVEHWLEGKPVGVEKAYFENGQTKYIIRHSADGKTILEHKSYYENGQIKMNKTVDNGQSINTNYYENGAISKVELYKSDKVLVKKFFQTKVLSSIGYRTNAETFVTQEKKIGKWKGYHTNGKRAFKGKYKNGKKTGKWKFYDKNGKLDSIEYWKNGKLKT